MVLLQLLPLLQRADLRKARSSTLVANGKVSSAAQAVNGVRSLLSIQSVGDVGAIISLGAPLPETVVLDDWEITIETSANEARVGTSGARTIDGELANRRLYESLRAEIPGALATPLALHVSDGLQDFGQWVESAVLAQDSPFAGDEVYPLSPSFDNGAELNLDPSSAPHLVAAFEEAGPVRHDGASGMSWIDIGAGIPEVHAALVLSSTAASCTLQLRCPPIQQIPLIRAQRLFRAFVAVLGRIVYDADVPPSVTEPVGRWLAAWLAQHEQSDRTEGAFTLGTSQCPTSQVPLREGWLPVGIVIETATALDLRELVAAQGPLFVRNRAYARGLRRRTREQSRWYTARRPGLLADETGDLLTRRTPAGDTAYYLRYAETDYCSPATVGSALPENSCFWELAFTSTTADGRARTLALISQASKGEGALSYGAELFAALSALRDVALMVDSSARAYTVLART